MHTFRPRPRIRRASPALWLFVAAALAAGPGACDDDAPGDAAPGGGGAGSGGGAGAGGAGGSGGVGHDLPAGSPCRQDSECAGGTCLENWVGGSCSGPCAVDEDCGEDGTCRWATARSPGSCLASCASDDDCRQPGYSCGLTRGACVGIASGDGAPLAPCTGSWDCAGGGRGSCATEDSGFYLGGACLAWGCEVDADCPATSHCADLDRTDLRYCLPGCASDAECRGSGYACGDVDADGRSECWRAGTGPAFVGEPCEGLWDCAGGFDAVCLRDGYPGGSCSLWCEADGECGEGAHCVFRASGAGWCVRTCAGDEGCRTGYVCRDLDADAALECDPSATGAGDVGDPCATIGDCAGGAEGFCTTETEWLGGYCGQTCPDGECPEGSHCAFGPSRDARCMADCSSDSDCREPDYGCRQVDAAAERECAPTANGSGAVGDRCLTLKDCAGGALGWCGDDWPGGYCYTLCGDDEPCPDGSVCVPEGVCLRRCAGDLDCRTTEGYACVSRTGISSRVCGVR